MWEASMLITSVLLILSVKNDNQNGSEESKEGLK